MIFFDNIVIEFMFGLKPVIIDIIIGGINVTPSEHLFYYVFKEIIIIMCPLNWDSENLLRNMNLAF